MKKIKYYLVFAVLLSMLSFNSHAASLETADIKLKIDDKHAQINGNEVVLETAPFIFNDVTMVPLRVIVEALGAKVNWKESERAVYVKHNSSTIRLEINNDFITVNGIKQKMGVVPVLSPEGSTMVPLRILVENFGCRVTWFAQTREILVVSDDVQMISDSTEANNNLNTSNGGNDKGNTGDSAEEALFQNIVESKIGDSYYNWSMDFSKGSIITYKSKDGRQIDISDKTNTLEYSVNITKADINSDVSTFLNSLDMEAYGKILTQEIYDRDNVKWAHIVYISSYYGTSEVIKDIRIAEKNGFIYRISLQSEDISGYYTGNGKEVLDSFAFGYKGRVENVRDINELEGGLYTYKDSTYQWSIKLPISVNVVKKIENNIYEISDESTNNNGLAIRIKFETVGNEESLSDFVDSEFNTWKKGYNDKYYTILGLENFELNGVNAKKVTISYKLHDTNYVSYSVYYILNNIKYTLSITVNKSSISESERNQFNEIFKTFEPIKLSSYEKSTKISNPHDLLNGINSKFVNTKYNWEMIYPANWNVSGNKTENTDLLGQTADNISLSTSNKVYFEDKYLGLSSSVTVESSNGIEDTEAKMEKLIGLWKGLYKDFKLTNKNMIQDKGYSILRYDYEFTYNDVLKHATTFVLNSNKKEYEVDYLISDENFNDFNIGLMNNMWKSFKLN